MGPRRSKGNVSMLTNTARKELSEVREISLGDAAI